MFKNSKITEQDMWFRVLVVTAIMIVLGNTAWGHHSHANYDVTDYTYLEGSVTEILWINPHIWIFIEVADDDGEPVQWTLETATPAALARNGVTRDTVHVGDTVSVRCHQLIDGAAGCLLGYLTGRDGVERLWD